MVSPLLIKLTPFPKNIWLTDPSPLKELVTELESNKINSSHRRDGFETSNADKIFESTYQKQVSK